MPRGMKDFREAARRAIAERSEPWSGAPDAMAALSVIVKESMRAQFNDWVRKIGRTNAERLWRDHFPGEDIPK